MSLDAQTQDNSLSLAGLWQGSGKVTLIICWHQTILLCLKLHCSIIWRKVLSIMHIIGNMCGVFGVSQVVQKVGKSVG